MDYIYFIHDPSTSTVKIGMSKNPEKRIRSLQSSMPQILHPIRYVQVREGHGYEVERFLHEKFAHLCVKGEWFQDDQELLDFAKDGQIPEMDEVKAALTPPARNFGARLSINEVGKRTGLSPRTIRYYIAEGLIPGPVTQGPRASYEEGHVEALKQIKALKDQGLSLGEIKMNLVPVAPVALEPEVRRRFDIIPGLVVEVSEEIPPHTKNVIFRALEQFARAVQTTTDVDEREEDDA